MAQETQTYKRSLSGSVGAGLSSVFGGGGRTYFILEHKVSSKYHKAGESQEIIVDEIEIGRDSKCQVQFDESFQTVSRRHAAIVRVGDNWKLIQLSKTNTTFLNGHPVANEWYLQNGDEIQLSVNGPKLGFIVPSGNKAKTGSIGLSRRLSLFRQQALKPYKTALASMGAAMVVLIAGFSTYAWLDYKHDVEVQQMTKEQLAEANLRAEQAIAEAAQTKVDMEKMRKKLERDFARKLEEIQGPAVDESVASRGGTSIEGTSDPNPAFSACKPYVYFVVLRRIVLTYDGQSKEYENIATGSGFMLDDGRFVTARHVVEPWMYPSGPDDEFNLICNAVAYNGGTATCYLEAYSPSGQKLTFTSTEAIVNRASDTKQYIEGVTICTASSDATDFAYFRTGQNKGLAYNYELSNNLPIQAKLSIYGYPLGLGGSDLSNINPKYSEAVVAGEGLEQGYILTTATTFEHGNSGGPVFVTTKQGNMIVIGIVSAGAGRSTGLVVPISAIQY